MQKIIMNCIIIFIFLMIQSKHVYGNTRLTGNTAQVNNVANFELQRLVYKQQPYYRFNH